MKKYILIIIAIAGFAAGANAQTHLNVGLGYYAESIENPGLILEFEYEKMRSETFSLPIRGNIGFHSTPGFNAMTFDLHTGFRKYFNSGLFLEQSVGFGIIAKRFKTEGPWYIDKYSVSIPHGHNIVRGYMPSVTIGAGYNFSKNKGGKDILWIRPKVYWDLGFRGLYLPYYALQLGFSHNFK